jgi:hypothetical protein
VGVDADASAARIAARHSERMRAAGGIFHNNDLRDEADDAGLDWSVIGENVGVGASVQAVHDAFMSSASHRHTILDHRYRLLGVGIAQAADHRVYVTQVFVRLGGTAARPAVDLLRERSSSSPHCAATLRAEDGSTVASAYYGDHC